MHEFYDNPLIGRYAGRRMARLWSAQTKFSTWRRLWVALAEAAACLGFEDHRGADRRPSRPGRYDRLRRGAMPTSGGSGTT